MGAILTGKGIFKAFEGDVQVLKDVNITIEEGEFLVVMGPSGSGKSTLLYALSGMDTIDQGQVIFDGMDITVLKDQMLSNIRRSKMGFIFQNSSLLKNLNLIDNIILPGTYDKKIKRHDLISKGKNLMEEVGLKGLENREISQVSGGQLQRASICRALINDPLIIFGDEPTGALNSKNTDEIIKLLSQINSQGTTIMLVSHDPKVAKNSHRVVFMKDGKLVDEIKLLGLGEDERQRLILKKMDELDI
ncbi:MAG: ABC transporter ATP-binding protein [Tissierellia bacterium]|nr:ABC transporter ATP-binding protein [Tissierellia bacterium]